MSVRTEYVTALEIKDVVEVARPNGLIPVCELENGKQTYYKRPEDVEQEEKFLARGNSRREVELHQGVLQDVVGFVSQDPPEQEKKSKSVATLQMINKEFGVQYQVEVHPLTPDLMVYSTPLASKRKIR